MSDKLYRVMLIAWLVAGGLLAGCGPATPTPSAEPIRIGGVFNLTGGLSSLDAPAANGAKLAATEINAAGGILGRPIDLLVLDGQTDGAQNEKIASRLVSQERVVALVGYTDSDSVLAAAPIAQRADIPFITVGATSPLLPKQVGPMLFMAPFGDNVQRAGGGRVRDNNLAARTVYPLWDHDPEDARLLAQYFKQRWTALAGAERVLREDTYHFGNPDVSAQIARLQALPQQSDFVYISAMPDDIGKIVKQMRDAGVESLIVGGDGYDTPLLIEDAGEAAENVYFTTHALVTPDNTTPAMQEFMDKYQTAYGVAPENAFAALGYDTIKLLADAIKRAGSTDSQAIVQALETTRDFPSITGAISFSPGSHIPSKAVTIIAVRSGRFTLATEVVPEQIPSPE